MLILTLHLGASQNHILYSGHPADLIPVRKILILENLPG